MIKTEGGALYKALIFPSVKKMPLETLVKIQALVKQGATVVFSGQYPEDVPGLCQLKERRKIFKEIIKQLRSEPTVVTNLKTLQRPESFITVCGGYLIRRKHDGGYIYFFTMLKNNPVNHWVALGTSAQSALFFDPMTGKKGKAKLRNNNEITEVYMQLQPGESIILKTFTGKNVPAEEWTYYLPTGKSKELKTGWKMRFIESEPTVNEKFQLHTLFSWTELNNDTLRKNMGTACYEIQFDFRKNAGKEYRLCLGDVRESAAITVNGHRIGTLFAVPFEINIGKWLKNSDNTIEIEVTNLPANRIADYDRRNVEWRIFHEINFVDITYSKTKYDVWQPLPSGLLGPVVLRELEKMK
jgi:hypothetical protein